MMERIRFSRTPIVLIWLIAIVAVTNSILGVSFLLNTTGESSADTGRIFQGSFMVLQGIVFISWSVYSINRRKYYIEWDDSSVNLYLPGTKAPESIFLSDIKSVSIRLFEAELIVAGSVRTLDLNSLKDADLKKIKAFLDKRKNSEK